MPGIQYKQKDELSLTSGTSSWLSKDSLRSATNSEYTRSLHTAGAPPPPPPAPPLQRSSQGPILLTRSPGATSTGPGVYRDSSTVQLEFPASRILNSSVLGNTEQGIRKITNYQSIQSSSNISHGGMDRSHGHSNGPSKLVGSQHALLYGSPVSRDPLFVDTDVCLSLVNETRPSYDLKTAGKAPLSPSHLLSLVTSNGDSAIAPPLAASQSHSSSSAYADGRGSSSSTRIITSGSTSRSKDLSYNQQPISSVPVALRAVNHYASSSLSKYQGQSSLTKDKEMHDQRMGRISENTWPGPSGSSTIRSSHLVSNRLGQHGATTTTTTTTDRLQSFGSGSVTNKDYSTSIQTGRRFFETPIRFRTDQLFAEFDQGVTRLGSARATFTPLSGTRRPLSHSEDQFRTYTSTDASLSRRPATPPFMDPLHEAGAHRESFVSPRARGMAPAPSDQPIRAPKQHGLEGEVDHLTIQLHRNMMSGCGAAGENNCAKCGEGIGGVRPGCTALDHDYHLECFTCCVCGKKLAGGPFYSVDGAPYCEADYTESLEKCATCRKPIVDRVLRASGKAYHPACFTCTSCAKCLDGVPFTPDSNNDIYCVPCFHDKYAPRCDKCSKPIVPEDGRDESMRVIAMEKSFHVACYKCEDCGLSLSSKIEGHGCYPLDNRLLCKDCSVKRIQQLE